MSSEPVAVLVEVPRQTGEDETQIDNNFSGFFENLEEVQGLRRMYVIESDDNIGGVYFWETKQAAEIFYNRSWQESVKSTHGAYANLTYFDAPTETPGGSEGAASSDGLVTIVKVRAPWYAPRHIIVNRMKEAIPIYKTVSGLDFKVFTIAEGKKVGGIYLWENSGSANEFYNAAWLKRIEETYGENAEILWFDSPKQISPGS